jgi:hypothetical protein
MSEAPERIWAEGLATSGAWSIDRASETDVEYVRADLAARLLALQDALACCYVVDNNGRRRTAEDCHGAILALAKIGA